MVFGQSRPELESPDLFLAEDPFPKASPENAERFGLPEASWIFFGALSRPRSHTHDDPSLQPDDGLRHADTVLERTVYSPEFYCTATEAAGLQLAPFLLNQRPVVHDPIGADSPEDREAAEAARAEAQRRERRKVITLNKLGAAAEEVRRRFVKQLLARLVDCTSWVSIGVGPAV